MRGLVYLVFLALLQSTVSFTVRPSVTAFTSTTMLFSTEEPAPEDLLPTNPTPPLVTKRMDPLIASLTRNDVAKSTKSLTVPLFGEIDVDGSLIVLVPAIVIGLVGFVMSIGVAMNAKDTFVDQLVQISDEINYMAIQKTNAVVDPNVCRGLCSTQEQDLDNLRGFMEGLRTKP